MSTTVAPPVLWRDERFVVLNKPAGLPAHAGRSSPRSVEDWFPALSRRRDGPWLVHRLDTDTAGCLLVALRKTPLLEAQALFAAGQVEKVYWAVVTGRPAGAAGRIESRLHKVSGVTGWRMVADANGQISVTDWRLVGEAAGQSWLELRPRTGRTHQIRVHCAALGCPIVGDPIYGASERGGLHLLARALILPFTPPIAAEAPPPPHMQPALQRCGLQTA